MPSQRNEDQIIAEHFGDRKGRFLDIGAYDGKTFSNTEALVGRGWEGVMVEASPKCFHLLQDNYRGVAGVKLVCCAVGLKRGLILFYDSGGAVASLSKEHMEKWKVDQPDFMDIYVPVITIADLLEVLPGPYHFISLDIEGLSIDVLNVFPDIIALGVELICIEATDGEESDRVRNIMGIRGYSPWKRTAENWLYKKG